MTRHACCHTSLLKANLLLLPHSKQRKWRYILESFAISFLLPCQASTWLQLFPRDGHVHAAICRLHLMHCTCLTGITLSVLCCYILDLPALPFLQPGQVRSCLSAAGSCRHPVRPGTCLHAACRAGRHLPGC